MALLRLVWMLLVQRQKLWSRDCLRWRLMPVMPGALRVQRNGGVRSMSLVQWRSLLWVWKVVLYSVNRRGLLRWRVVMSELQVMTG